MGASSSAARVTHADSAGACSHSAALEATHAKLGAQLGVRGFDERAIASAAAFFTADRPRRYEEPPWSLPPDAVRALVLPLDDHELSDRHAVRLGALALQAASQLAAALPAGTHAWIPPAGTLHTTIFHPGASPTELNKIPAHAKPAAPSSAALQHELEAARLLAARVPINLSLVVDRLALTPAGVLLLLLRPAADGAAACVHSLRTAAAAAFPQAARAKQTSGIVHVSLLRILSLPRAADYGPNATAAQAANRLVAAWSARLHGLPARIRGLVHVREAQIMTLDGTWSRLRFGAARRASVKGGRARRASALSLADVLERGGTRPGYDHDRPWTYQ